MKSRLGPQFKKIFKRLPKNVKSLARKNFKLWVNNPSHPSLNFKSVSKKDNLYSVRIGDGWRVLGIKDKETILWIWIGSHEDYNKLV